MIEVSGVSACYISADTGGGICDLITSQYALNGVSCSFSPGEVVSLAGLNGSGKSTLSRLLCAMRLADAGCIVVDGVDPANSEHDRLAVRKAVGFVQQDPADQIVSTLVFDEVAFGPRNLGLDEDDVCERVRASLAAVGLDGFEKRDVSGLSGGEQQRLALAGVLAMDPAYLVLDEATSHLDSAARPAFRALVDDLAHKRGLGIVQVTHDPVELLASDRVMVLDVGRLIWQGSPEALLMGKRDLWDSLTLQSMNVSAVQMALEGGAFLSSIRSPHMLATWLKTPSGSFVRSRIANDGRFSSYGQNELDAQSATSRQNGRGGIEVRDVSFAYDDARPVLRSVSLRAEPGRLMLLAGRSGSGKSTLAMLLAGLSRPDAGEIFIDGLAAHPARCGLAFQRPENQLFLQTVREEIAFAPRNAGVGAGELDGRVREIAARVGLDEELLDRSPFELSGGQARRVGLACVLSLGAPAYVLDEPTAGLDAPGRRDLHRLVRELAAEGSAVVLISHDLDEWLCEVDDVALMADGHIAWSGPAGELWESPGIYRSAGIEPPDSAMLLEALWAAGAQRSADAKRVDGGMGAFDGEHE